jgi:hypothetical protein
MRKIYNHSPKSVSLDNVATENGKLITAPTYFYTENLNIMQEMTRYQVIAPAINIFDEQIQLGQRLFGGKYWIHRDSVDKVHSDDYVEFSIIDKDNILGMFDMFGLSIANGDFIEITKFIIRDYVDKGNPSNGFYSDLTTPTSPASEIPPGLYRRVAYYSAGGQPLTIYVKYYYYK